MRASVYLPVVLGLGLIWIAQLIFAPFSLSIILMLMWLCVIRHIKKLQFQAQHQIQRSTKLICVFLALLSIYWHYQSFIGVEAGTALLAVFLFAKALEMKSKRDFIILFNFALFVSASLFLHSQSIWMAILVLACLISCLFGLYRVQTVDFKVDAPSVMSALNTDLKLILKFIGYAFPFFIVLFLFFPRFPPLWHIPLSTDEAVTGISDRMSPGDIAELSQSSELAFRVLVDLKKLPPQHALYWRAMVLDHYDGRTWTGYSFNQPLKVLNQDIDLKNTINYQYLPADMSQRWIMSLEKSIPNERRFSLHQDDAITANRLIQRNQPIQLTWLGEQPSNSIQSREFSPQQYQALASYPQHLDPQAQQLAKLLFKQSDYDSERYIQKVIDWYRNNDFVYSLKPGVLGQHRIDEFLFERKQGFCEHYASSFVMLMRYVGIPSRVVVGYQGGQAAPDQNSWEVRQLDAHAWTEVWLNGQWKRIDPTAVIAPQRLDMGMQNYISNDQQVLGDEQFSALKYQQYALLKNLRIWSDYASFQWQNKVVGYDSDQQQQWLKRLGLNSNYRYGLLMIGSMLMLGFIYGIWMYYRRYTQSSELDRIIARFSQQLTPEQHRQQSESFQHWLNRLSQHNDHLSELKDKIIQNYQKIVYLDQTDNLTLSALKKLLKEYAIVLKQ